MDSARKKADNKNYRLRMYNRSVVIEAALRFFKRQQGRTGLFQFKGISV